MFREEDSDLEFGKDHSKEDVEFEETGIAIKNPSFEEIEKEKFTQRRILSRSITFDLGIN